MEDSWIWLFQLMGRLHVLIVHFPIGLLVMALVLEGLTLNGRRPGLKIGSYWMVYFGTIFAIIAVILGCLLRNFDDYSGALVQQHQNMGIATAALATGTVLILRATVTGRISTYNFYRSGLILTVLSLIFASHLGASLTHGEDYLSSALPLNNEPNDSEVTRLLAELKVRDSLNLDQLDELNLEVRAIIAHNCYQCHNDNKQKGELVLDSKRGFFQGGKSGPVIFPNDPQKSELYRRISLPAHHKEVMPKKGKVLKEHEVALIKLWIEKGAHWSDRAISVFPEAPLALEKPLLPEDSNEDHPVDQLINAYFQNNNYKWPGVVDDKIFIRRAHLDIVGLLPQPDKILQFVNDGRPNKRELLIDELLNDHTNYTQHWLSFWNDLLRNDYSGTGFITGGRKQITDWLYATLESNKPYDLMVKELVNPSEESMGFIKGIQWRGVVNASQRTEMQAAQNIGQSLMGVNVKCASCHNSFVSNLTLEQAYGFASIFADSTLELYRCDKPIGKFAGASFIYPELGSVDGPSVDRRLAKLSAIIVKPENGRLYRTITNRIWKQLMGRGLVEPVDEMDHLPWDNDLLDWLSADFMDSGYDLKSLIRQIMISKAYQLPSIDYDKVEDLRSDKFQFRGPLIRRLSAEQFSDAVSQVIAPVFYAAAYDPNKKGLSSRRIWHPEVKYDRSVLPDPGVRYFRNVFTISDSKIESAELLLSVDHSYTMYLNEQEVSKGADWRKVHRLDVKDYIVSGKNLIAIEGINEGSIANPAGILFAMKIVYTNKEEVLIQSGKDWQSTKVKPDKTWIRLQFNDESWVQVRDYGSSHWDKLIGFNFNQTGSEFARASLVRQHHFLKALGRPSRETVTTNRDDQATLLQALELTNGEYLNNVLEEGAKVWHDLHKNKSEKIVETLYQKALGRSPTIEEREVILSSLGSNPTKESLQDFFWSIILLPEFQFID